MSVDLPDEATARFIQQIEEFWLNPEIERRLQEGRFSEDTALYAVQVIFNRGSPVQVRLNGEVRADVTVRPTSPLTPGQEVSLADIEHIEDIELTEDDPNAGHITLLRHNDSWAIRFDFRHNAAHVTMHIEVAQEFLRCAEFALSAGLLRAFVENILAANELMAKALLMTHDAAILDARRHNAVRSRFNMWGAMGNTDERYTRQYNRLSETRQSARYPTGAFNLAEDEARVMLEVAQEMFASVQESAPRRARAAQGASLTQKLGEPPTT